MLPFSPFFFPFSGSNDSGDFKYVSESKQKQIAVASSATLVGETFYTFCTIRCKPQFLSFCAQAIPSRILFVMLKSFCRICVFIHINVIPFVYVSKKAQRNTFNVYARRYVCMSVNVNPICVRYLCCFPYRILGQKFVRHPRIKNENRTPTKSNVKTKNTTQFINISRFGGLSGEVCLRLIKYMQPYIYKRGDCFVCKSFCAKHVN